MDIDKYKRTISVIINNADYSLRGVLERMDNIPEDLEEAIRYTVAQITAISRSPIDKWESLKLEKLGPDRRKKWTQKF